MNASTELKTKCGEPVTIARAGQADLGEILELQYLAYQSEARLLNNYNIQPLQQTYADICLEFEQAVFLKALDREGKIIGSVRGRPQDDTLHIGKLIVDPGCRRRGIGSLLLSEIEQACDCGRYELFTSSASVNNLKLYTGSGYQLFAEKQVAAGLTLVFLEKYRKAAP